MTPTQLGIDGIPPLPAPRPPGRPTKDAAKRHDAALARAVMPTAAQAQAAGELGAERAGEHADAVSGGWRDRACAWVLVYGRKRKAFLMEEARAFAIESGLEEPPDARAWGSVTRRLSGQRLIRRTGGHKAAKTSNNSEKPLWTLT